ncbi:hypothetical protein C6A25_08175 [Streptococcus anginosus]|nr:hypothetical protein C6A25_08175 [Streptococcus anginosus]
MNNKVTKFVVWIQTKSNYNEFQYFEKLYRSYRTMLVDYNNYVKCQYLTDNLPSKWHALADYLQTHDTYLFHSLITVLEQAKMKGGDEDV